MTEMTWNNTEEKTKYFLNLLRNLKYGKTDYHVMLDLLTPDVIIEIAAHPQKWISLYKIQDQLRLEDLLDFRSRVFSVRNQIPKLELLKVWCRKESLIDHSYFRRNESKILDKCADLNLLIDSPFVCELIVRKKTEGWKNFRYATTRPCKILSLHSALADAVEKDVPASFAIAKDMTGQHFSYSLLMMILRSKAYKIFQFLLENDGIPENVITFPELCKIIVTTLNQENAIPFLKLMDVFHPGCLKDFRDSLGRNLLWYVLYNWETVWFHPRCELVSFLIEQGCDPENCNQIGLSWSYVSRNLPMNLKKKWLSRCGFLIQHLFPEKELIPESGNVSKEALKIVSKWTETAVIHRKFGLPKLKKLTRSRSREPLFLEIRKKLGSYLCCGPVPDLQFLPDSWNDFIRKPTIRLPKLWVPDPNGKNNAKEELWQSDGTMAVGLASIPLKTGEPIPYADAKEEALVILRTGLLVYHEWVREYYCRQKYPGYQILRHFGGETFCNYPLHEKYLPLIKEDKLPEFALLYGMDPDAGSLGMFYDILQKNASRIRDWLLDEREDFLENFSPEELLFFGISNIHDDQTVVSLIDAVEARWQGTAARAHDCFGSNLLWYCNYNFARRTGDNIVQKRLLRAFCRPSEQNLFGLAPQDLLYLRPETAA